jgi:hypothetical protein
MQPGDAFGASVIALQRMIKRFAQRGQSFPGRGVILSCAIGKNVQLSAQIIMINRHCLAQILFDLENMPAD